MFNEYLIVVFKIEFSLLSYNINEVYTQTDDTLEQILIDSMHDMKIKYNTVQNENYMLRHMV